MQTVSRFFWGTLGELVSQNVNQLSEFNTEFDSDNLQIQLSILTKSYHSFRQGNGGDTLHNVVDFLKKNRKIWSLIPEVMSLVKIILVTPAQMPALNMPSVY